MATNNCVDQQSLSNPEKAALLEQLEELKAQLQSEKESSLLQGQKVTELSKNLEDEENQNKILSDQVEYLTMELDEIKIWVEEQGNMLRKMTARCLKEERRRIKYARELEEVKDQLKIQKIREELWQEREKGARSELENLKVSLRETKERYEKELKAERKKNRDLPQQMSFQEAIKRLQAQQDAFKQEMEERMKLQLQVVSERNNSFCKEIQDLKINLIEQMSTKVEEQVSNSLLQALQEELTKLREKKKEERKEEDKPLPALEAPELLTEALVSEEKTPDKKKTKMLLPLLPLGEEKESKGEEGSTSK